MKLAYFDCFSGISGDMTLGALLDAGVSPDVLRAALRGLNVPGWSISSEKVWKNGMSATFVRVATEDQSKHRGLSAILEILGKSELSEPVRNNASAIFRKLGEAEASVHDVPLEKIHFHEVGAVDAIVDIVGACIGFAALGIQKFACSPLNIGGGTAKMAHGVLPVPAPATAKLLQGKPTYSNGVQRELVTPTGAAIVATSAHSFGPQPAMSVSAIGYGAGAVDLEGQPDVVGIMIGEAAEKVVPGFDEEISVIEANLDDMNPQIYGYFEERALAAGALGCLHHASANEKKPSGHAAHCPLQAVRYGNLNVADFSRNDHLWHSHLQGAATDTSARIGQCAYTIRRRTHQTVPRQRTNFARRAGIRRLPQISSRKKVPLQRVISDALRAYNGGS